jgi:3-hydroxyacyl-CoA dehydrogenase
MPPLVETLEPLRIKKVTVLGAGPVGVGIAAHLANLGFEVSLLDSSAARAEESVAKAIQAKPAQFYTQEQIECVRCGGTDDDLGVLEAVDWVCEALPENVATKRELLATVEQMVPAHAIVTTATDFLDVSEVSAGRSESFRRRFFGAHFMPPPRYVKLLELTTTTDTDPQLAKRAALFFEEHVGRRVVLTKNTPGFVSCRIGVWEILHALHTAEKLQLDIELVDAVTSLVYGTPGIGVSRLADAIGLDFLSEVAGGVAARCADDPLHAAYRPPASLASLIGRGCLGEKVGRGYNRIERGEAFIVDLVTLAYRQVRPPYVASLKDLAAAPPSERLRLGLGLRDEAGEFLRTHFVPTLQRTDALKESISNSVRDIDDAVKWAFGRSFGPFEMMDQVGREAVGVQGEPFYRDGRFRSFAGAYVPLDADPRYKPLEAYPVAREEAEFVVRDLGDGVRGVTLRPTDGIASPAFVEDVHRLLDSGDLDRFVLTFAGKERPFTYDLPFLLDKLGKNDVMAIELTVRRLQELTAKLSGMRCVAAVEGRCFGAFFEMAMQCAALVAHPEAVVGLNLAHAGLIPAGGGLTAMRLRNQDLGLKALADAALQIVSASRSTCAEDAKRKGFLRQNDRIVSHPDRLLWEAIELAKTVEPAPKPNWAVFGGPLAGVLDRRQDESKGRLALTAHDEAIGEKVKLVFARAGTYAESLAQERRGFIDLCGKALTQARMRHLIANGTPLRN